MPGADNAVIQERRQSLLTPAIFGQISYYRSLGLRDRILSLPVMVAAVLVLLWRQVPSVCELAKMLVRVRGHDDGVCGSISALSA